MARSGSGLSPIVSKVWARNRAPLAPTIRQCRLTTSLGALCPDGVVAKPIDGCELVCHISRLAME